jgi:hypothetical protein
MVSDLPQIEPPSGVYKGCVMGKHHQGLFLKDKARKTYQSLALIHNDMNGPMATLLFRKISTSSPSVNIFLTFFG